MMTDLYSLDFSSTNAFDVPCNTVVGDAHLHMHGSNFDDILTCADMAEACFKKTYVNGNDGNDIIVSCCGRSTLAGGQGADIFVISPTNNITYPHNVVIEDFNVAEDKIDLSGFNVSSISVTHTDLGCRITLKNNLVNKPYDSILIKNCIGNNINSEHFIVHSPTEGDFELSYHALAPYADKAILIDNNHKDGFKLSDLMPSSSTALLVTAIAAVGLLGIGLLGMKLFYKLRDHRVRAEEPRNGIQDIPDEAHVPIVTSEDIRIFVRSLNDNIEGLRNAMQDEAVARALRTMPGETTMSDVIAILQQFISGVEAGDPQTLLGISRWQRTNGLRVAEHRADEFRDRHLRDRIEEHKITECAAVPAA